MNLYHLHIQTQEQIAHQGHIDHLEHLQSRKEKLLEELENANWLAAAYFPYDRSTDHIKEALRLVRHELEDLDEELEGSRRGMR